MVGRQTPILALFVPLVLMFMIDGRRGVRQTWPAAIVCGVAFAIAQFACANYFSAQLTDIFASLVSTGAVIVLLRVWQPTEPLAPEGRGLGQLKWAILTVLTVLALAYVMNLSGQTVTLGQWMAGAGAFFAFLSSILGWLGVAVSGSDTSSNSLFGLLQVTAGHQAGLSPTLLAAANSSGGVLGKMISPQNLAIGASAVGMTGQEGELFRKVLGWSLAFLLVMCVLVFLQSTILSGMVVGG